MQDLEGFTATSIGGEAVSNTTNENEPKNEVQQNEGGQVNDGVQAEQGESPNAEQGNNEQNVGQDPQVTHAVSEEKVQVEAELGNNQDAVTEPLPEKQEQVQQEAVKFETSTVELDKKVETPVQSNRVDVLSFLEENGDLISQYNKLNTNFDDMDEAGLIEAHLKAQHPNLDQEDINTLLADYSYDEESSDRAEIVRKKIATDKAVSEARTYLNETKESLRSELEKRNLGGPSEADIQQQERNQQAVQKFNQATDNFFGQEFEGFAFQLNDEKAMELKINNKESVMKQQASIETFLQPYFDNDGNITDAPGYHKAIFSAMNIDAITRNAYEQGKAHAILQVDRDAKNIDMDGHSTHASNPVPGTTWKII